MMSLVTHNSIITDDEVTIGIDEIHGIDDTDDFRQEDNHDNLIVITLQCDQLLFLLSWNNGNGSS